MITGMMQKLEIDGKSAVWLDHRELINHSYKDSSTGIYYKLKRELFYFNAEKMWRNSTVRDDTDSTYKKVSKRNKKRKLTPSMDEFHSDLKETTTAFLKQLKERGFFAIPTFTVNAFYRCWEDKHSFTKFSGANYTNEFQNVNFNQQTYIIPPHCILYNRDVMELTDILNELQTFDLIIMDPPWRNKYVRRLKRIKTELGYQMLNNTELIQLPIKELIHRQTLVAIWCTNSTQIQKAVLRDFFPAWNLRHLHTIQWMKANTSGILISQLNETGKKQPYETLYIACHTEDQRDFKNIAVDILISIPSIVHSHKPPLLELLRSYLPTAEPKCLELFGRYLQPRFTSIGLEVLKLMDDRLYEKIV